MSIAEGRKQELVKEFGANAKDTGNSDVQVAILTERIKNLTEHMKANHKDNHTERGLLRLVATRKKLLTYIRGKDEARYQALIKKLGLRK